MIIIKLITIVIQDSTIFPILYDVITMIMQSKSLRLNNKNFGHGFVILPLIPYIDQVC